MPERLSPSPLIGITTRNDAHPEYGYPTISSPRSYTRALIEAGATPLLVPINLPHPQAISLLDRLDAFIFTGGGDIETRLFNGQDHERVYGIDPERDRFELALAKEIAGRQIPFIGICRGLQVINVALGGTLYTHVADQLPDSLEHACFPTHPTDHPAHSLELKPGSRLAAIFKAAQIEVNSIHHQGIKDLAPGLDAAGWASDGLVEAFEFPNHPFGLAVQWHPEWMPSDPAMQAFFAAFIQAALDYRARQEIPA